MYRIAIEKLLKWKQSKRRKPLIIEGARQVGKTWLMKEFGRQAYADTVYINFDSNSRMAELFASDLDTERLIMGLELYVGRKIDPDHSLLIFDEVQEVPRALASLKYFYENGFFRNYPYHSPFAYISFAAKSALLHLPYIVRFTIFNLLFVPSTKPFESSLATEFSTASISFSNPFANRDISFKSEFL